MTATEKKKRGRPKIGGVVGVRFPRAMYAAINAYQAGKRLSQAGAIRRATARGLNLDVCGELGHLFASCPDGTGVCLEPGCGALLNQER